MDRSAIDSIARAAIEAWGMPGLAVAVVSGDETYTQGYGVREIGKDDLVTPETLFAVGSITKSFTTASMAMLIDEGKMSWDDHPRRHIPHFKLLDPLADANVTLRDMVAHRTGLARHDALWYRSLWSTDELLVKVGLLPPAFSFRSTYQYNNLLYMAAGRAVEAASGITWEQFVKTRIFEPLGMSRSILSTNDLESSGNYCTPHAKKDEEIIAIPWCNLDNVGACGSLNSCASDIAQWVRFHLGDGTWEGKQLISKRNLDEMHSAQMVIPIDENMRKLAGTTIQSYCLGWNLLNYRGHTLVLHGGAIDGFNASVVIVPEKNVGIAVLSNLSNDMAVWSVRNGIIDHLLDLQSLDWSRELAAIQKEARDKEKTAEEERKAKRVEGTSPSKELADYAGIYEDAAYGQAKVTIEDGVLTFTWNNHLAKLEHFHFDTFAANLEPPDWPIPIQVTFILGPDASVEKLRLVWPESGLDREFQKAKAEQ